MATQPVQQSDQQQSDPGTAPEIQPLTELLHPEEGAIAKHVLLKAGGGAATLLAFGVGAGLPEHTASAEVLLCALTGEAEVEVESQPAPLKAGQAVRFPKGVPHAVRAASGPCTLLLITLKDT